MDPLTLLKEIYGEDTIRKILTSGFDSVGKIAAATPDSLSYFTGLPEGLAAQVILAAEKALGRPGPGSEENRPGAPIRPRLSPPRSATPRKAERRDPKARPEGAEPAPEEIAVSGHPAAASLLEDSEEVDSLLLDEEPLLDAGGLLKTFAARSQPREVFDDPDDILSEVGLTGAEADFLDGIASPWPNVPPPDEGSIPVLLAPPEPERAEPPYPVRSAEIELAGVTDWTWERDPDPVPRIIRAAELGPSPAGEQPDALPVLPKREDDPSAGAVGRPGPESAGSPESEGFARTSRSGGTGEAAPSAITARRSFWRFGR